MVEIHILTIQGTIVMQDLEVVEAIMMTTGALLLLLFDQLVPIMVIV
jgi:hypothetical protein